MLNCAKPTNIGQDIGSQVFGRCCITVVLMEGDGRSREGMSNVLGLVIGLHSQDPLVSFSS
jgi:hypothetical protein